jgi:5'-nucleotidase
MRILLTNDDGYRALGINTLYHRLVKEGHEVTIVAPEINSSGTGQAITVYMPMSITQVSEHVYFVSSTPADSVRLGLQFIYGTQENYPDLVISGINMGENIGEDVLYSGTVGSAKEGLIHGIPSLAISTPGPHFNHMEDVSMVVVDLINRICRDKSTLAKPFIWNVNIPHKPLKDIHGFEATKLGMRPLHKPFAKQITPRGQVIYWQGESSEPLETELGTDIDVFLKQDKVSITPIKLMPTDYGQMPLISALTV